MPHPDLSHAIILFDGVCNLCNNFVKFVISHDKQAYFKFAALQSDTAQTLLSQMRISPEAMPDSVVLIDENTMHIKSDAALYIARRLNGPVKYLYYLIFVPQWLRDPVYDLIARNRYAWFGRKSSCMVPTPEIKSRFL
jgi:predicted DCC family thiol-disulfide oxidoreductase YuxK